jgi:hypothetical protein
MLWTSLLSGGWRDAAVRNGGRSSPKKVNHEEIFKLGGDSMHT